MIRFVLAFVLLALPVAGAEAPRKDGRQTPYVEIRRTDAPCPPLAILSPGFGGTERELGGLAGLLADRGFRVLVMGHAESGPDQLRAALRSSDRRAAIIAGAGDPAAHRARFLDLDAVWAVATARCRPAFALLAGHSMGAQTTMMEAGAVARIGATGRDRFDAYVALSPQGVGLRFASGAWAGVSKPVLMVTGTRDSGVDGDWTTRLSAFDGLPPGTGRLAIVAGATHMNLGGRGFGRAPDLVLEVVGDWLDDLAAPSPGSPRAHPGVSFRQN
jgi:dienelactone hydrolase